MDDVGWSLVLIICLSGATLFFSVNSLALRIFSRVKLQEAFKALKKESRADKVIDSAEKLTWTCSFFRMVSNIAILLVLLTIFVRHPQGTASMGDIVSAVVIALALFLVFSLAIPHAWSKYAGEKVLARTYRLLTLAAVLVYPVLLILQLYDVIVRRLAGVVEPTEEEAHEEKQEEFLSVVEEHTMKGAFDEEEQEMIEHVLELSDTSVEKIMTPRTDIVAIDADADLKSVLDTVTNAGHSRIPIYEENIDKIIGLIYAKDLLAEIGNTSDEFNLRDKMRQAYFVPETKLLRILLHEFQSQKLHIAVVLDEYGGTAGIVTIEDILEELVGEITDEYEDAPAESIRQIDPKTVEIDARMHIDDINEEFELELPEDEDYDTIGGFVFSHLGYIPKSGETFDYENLKFSITVAGPRKVNRVRIEKCTDNKTPEQ